MDAHISLSSDLIEKIEREANARGMSLSEFVRITLESAIVEKSSLDDPLHADDAVYRDNGTTDSASEHDEYLYGDSS